MDEPPDIIAADESGPTTNRSSARSERVEIITRGERRRRWTVEQKRDIVAESYGPDLTPTEVARNHGALPAHLPRYEVVIDAAPENCPCCGGAMHRIGELCTEQLDIVPAQLRVRVTRRPRYACRTCEEAVVMAPAPARPVDGGMPTEGERPVSRFC